jgi:hypothetical protein
MAKGIRTMKCHWFFLSGFGRVVPDEKTWGKGEDGLFFAQIKMGGKTFTAKNKETGLAWLDVDQQIRTSGLDIMQFVQ